MHRGEEQCDTQIAQVVKNSIFIHSVAPSFFTPEHRPRELRLETLTVSEEQASRESFAEDDGFV